jgi:hypothetical protein
MFVFPLYSFPKRTHTYVLRPFPLDVTKTWPFSENSFISLSYFCEQLCLPSKRGACVGCGYNNMAETHTRGRNIDFYVLFSCGYILISTLMHVFESIHVFCFDVYVWFPMYVFSFPTHTLQISKLAFVHFNVNVIKSTHTYFYQAQTMYYLQTCYLFLANTPVLWRVFSFRWR